MRWLLDTNIVSELRKGQRAHPAVLAWRRRIRTSEACLSVITLMELALGGLYVTAVLLARRVQSHRRPLPRQRQHPQLHHPVRRPPHPANRPGPTGSSARRRSGRACWLPLTR